MELSSFWKENGIFGDVARDFSELLNDGMTRTKITKQIMADYQAELDDIDDSIFVLAGLAYAQIQSGGILKGAKEAVLSSCDTMTAYLSDGGRDKEEAALFLSAIDNLKAYAEKGKPEKRERLSCHWKLNDVYALCLHGEGYKSVGLEGKWLFFRTVGFTKSGRDIFPYVYLSITQSDTPLQTEAQLKKAACYAEYLPVLEANAIVKQEMEPGESSKSKYAIVKRIVYRAMLTWESQERFASLDFVYVGNFEKVDLPFNESLIPPAKGELFSAPMSLAKLEYGICWRYEQYIKNNPDGRSQRH